MPAFGVSTIHPGDLVVLNAVMASPQGRGTAIKAIKLYSAPLISGRISVCTGLFVVNTIGLVIHVDRFDALDCFVSSSEGTGWCPMAYLILLAKGSVRDESGDTQEKISV